MVPGKGRTHRSAPTARVAAAKRGAGPFGEGQTPAQSNCAWEVIPAPPIIQPRPRVVPRYFFFSFGPCTARFLFFFWKKKRKWGVHCPASILAESPPPEGRVPPSPCAGGHKKRQPIPSCLFFCRKTESHFTAFTTSRVKAKRPMALGMTIRLLNISDSSHTRSLDARVPRKINTRAISV